MSTPRYAFFAAALLAIAALAAPARADPVDAIVRAGMARQHIPGLGLAVVRNGTVIKDRGDAHANLEHRIPVDADTFFQTASVAKMLTAARILLLVTDGKLALDTPVATDLPDVPAAWSGITVRQLLNHTSGLDSFDKAIDATRAARPTLTVRLE